MENIWDIIEKALANSGYKIQDGDDKSIIFRDTATDTDYRLTLEEEA